MKENEQRGLQKINLDKKLPIGFDKLSEKEQSQVLQKLQAQDIELRGELGKRLIKSHNAEHDLAIVASEIERLDHNKKFYTIRQKVESGAGDVEIKVKGGDTKFIIPILVVIGLIILGIIYILTLR